MLEAFTKGFWAVAEVFGYAKHRSDLCNTPEMQRRQEAQRENEQDDKDNEAIRNRDEKAAKNSLS